MDGSASRVDEDLYSRQLYAIGGHTAQRALSRARVLIVGLRGIGVEIG
jgi:molybdopterin/thiamine biosynthesis adenylyltransferase